MIGTVEHVALGRWGEHREGAPLIAVAARGAYDRFDGLLSSIPAYSESAWHGTVADVDAFGPVLGPLALDFRRLSLLTAPSAAALFSSRSHRSTDASSSSGTRHRPTAGTAGSSCPASTSSRRRSNRSRWCRRFSRRPGRAQRPYGPTPH